ncbi:CBN-GBF-1 protein [Caenorhabditis brenneri]|uniref:CBN-GBF-1 protein n=1 Tax=Caenorhabditis brenneri TaxID=135651 RepID=G0MLE0_CAEBE|nr:CBN-GBF-1 protein [Caenorhabditis brenneri]
MATNGVYIVLGEANCVVALLNKARRQYQLSQVPTLEDTDPLLRNFTDLKEVLNEVADLADMNPQTYLSPFLDVIKAQNTNGPITEAALAAVAKFLNYGLIDASSIKAANAVESIAYAVVHTKFIGGKSTGSDECVLFKILQVLRSLLLSPPGILLSNEAVCDMMQSCFRIVFEQNLSLLLRKAAESTLADMTQLIFTRLPTFVEDTRHPYIRQLVNPTEKRQKRKKKRQLSVHIENKERKGDEETIVNATESTKLIQASSEVEIDGAAGLGYDVVLTTDPPVDTITHPDHTLEKKKVARTSEGEEADSESEGGEEERPIKAHGGLQREIVSDEEDPLSNDGEQVIGAEEKMPYGLPCCRELLRFLITMINPLDRHNTESMVVLGLNLLIVALEAVADFLPNYDVLMPLIKNELCRSLLQLLDTEKLPVLAATNRCCFLLFESMRMHLKFQLESYLKKLQTIVLSEKNHTNSGTEQKEMALESLVQLWRIPGLVTEMYLNFDCDLYCGNIFEDLTKLLVENSFPTLGGHTASLLSLDALLVVIETIEQNCEDRENGRGEVSKEQEQKDLKKLGLPVLSGYDIGKKMTRPSIDAREKLPNSSPIPAAASTLLLRSNRHAPSANLPSMTEVIEQKKRKRLIAEGTELFNQSPKKGIAFLREKGILGHDEESLVQWLRTNPQLDKKAIADYICNRKHAEVLRAFVKSFPFENTRLDVALRMFLETFRLPGESAEISLVMQHFSEEWFTANNSPFNHVDAAFTLSYAIIMLNVDQHNPQAKRNQPPMTVDCFKKNLSGTNGSKDFDPEMVADMYHAIKSEEIVMPAEQKGSVKEDYMWKVLLRRGETTEGAFFHAPTGWNDHDLFAVCWGPAVAALSYVFDKSDHEQILQKALTGYRKCAKISAYYGMNEVFDNLCIHLCKFTTLTSMREGGAEDSLDLQRHRSLADVSNSGNSGSSHGGLSTHSPEVVSLAFGENHKAQLATRTLFYLVHENGNILREGWRNLCEVLLQLFRARLLPADLIEVEDYVDEKGWVSIQRVHQKELPKHNDSGLLSWFGLGGGSSDTDRRKPTQEQLSAMKLASQVIAECRPAQIVADSKYLTSTSLAEMLSSIAANSAMIVEQAEPQQKTASLSGEDEDALVFYLELIVAITLENKDRLPLVWPHVRRHLEWLLSPRFGRCPVLVERAVVGLLRVANRNLFRDNTVSDDVLHSLAMLLRLSPKALFVFSRQIAFGLYELIRANAANVHKKEHWAVLFALLEAAGAAVLPDEYAMQLERNSLKVGGDQRNAYSDVEGTSGRGGGHGERGYTSEGEERRRGNYDSASDLESRVDSAGSLAGAQKQPADWIHLDHKDAAKATEEALNALGANAHKKNFRQYGSLVLRNGLGRHEPAAFLKVCECLAFLLRDAVHVTPDNFESSLQCLRTMVEASLDGGVYAAGPLSGDAQNRLRSTATEERAKKHHHHHTHHGKKKDLSTDVVEEADDSRNEEQQLTANYQQMSLHLLDLCSQLHSQTPAIFAKWAQQASDSTESMASVAFIWTDIWRPLLQAMGRLSCDCRRGVRAAALTHLQRAFLPANMATLGAAEWQSCFGEVLFPLLTKLLEPFSPMDPIGMEDTRVRTLQIVAKTLLNHLSALSALESFPDLWMLLLDYMEQYLRVDSCGNLNEAVPESLKNMLLVMDSTAIFAAIPDLYEMTVERLNRFMPQLIKDTIPNPPNKGQVQQHPEQALPSQIQASPKHASGLEPPTSSTPATSSSESCVTQSSTSAISVAEPPLVTCLEDVTAATAPIPIQQPVVPLTEVIVHSGPTSPIGSPPQSQTTENPSASSPPQHHQQQMSQQQYEQYQQHQQHAAAAHYPQYSNYHHQHQHQHHPNPHQSSQYQQQQYPYSPEAAAYYQQQQQYAPQQAYHEQYANQFPHPNQYYQQQPAVNSTSPSVHGQFSVANPLPLPSHSTSYHPIVSPSANSAFSQVYTSTQSNTPAQQTSQESPYFTPIPYNPNQQQQP